MIELRSKGEEDDALVSALGWGVFAPKLILQICMKFSTNPVKTHLTCAVSLLRKFSALDYSFFV